VQAGILEVEAKRQFPAQVVANLLCRFGVCESLQDLEHHVREHTGGGDGRPAGRRGIQVARALIGQELSAMRCEEGSDGAWLEERGAASFGGGEVCLVSFGA